MQDLARFFFVPFKILFPGSGLRCCGCGCAVCWVWVQLCPLTSAAGAVAIGAATAMPAGAGDPPAARCCAWRAWAYAASGGFPLSWASASLVQWWVRLARGVTGGGFLRLCFLLVVWEVLPVFSVFRGYGSGFLPPTSGCSFIGGASAWFCPLLRLTAVSLACGLAFAVFCGSGGFPRGY